MAAYAALEDLMSLKEHMVGIRDWLSTSAMQGALRRLMEEALREGPLDVYCKIKFTEKDDDSGMVFYGLQQYSFVLLCCFGECNERTHVSNPKRAGKYAAAFIWAGWTKSEGHG